MRVRTGLRVQKIEYEGARPLVPPAIARDKQKSPVAERLNFFVGAGTEGGAAPLTLPPFLLFSSLGWCNGSSLRFRVRNVGTVYGRLPVSWVRVTADMP